MDKEAGACQQVFYCSAGTYDAPDVGGFDADVPIYALYHCNEKNQSIWIAQREGRAKDSNDRTQDSVLKMLAMGGEGDLIDRLKEMNIAPLAISYEYDPCDFLKAREFQLKRDIEGYKKTTQDDLMNMQTGLFGYKGKVHFQVASCIND